MTNIPGLLSEEQAFSSQGCGAGTENACFALTMGSENPGQMLCAMVANPGVASMAGIQLGWRVNVDPTDSKAWCPLGILNNSKSS